jgi:PAS domain S-box-containing protein
VASPRKDHDPGSLAYRARLLDHIGQAVIATDLSGEIIYANAAAYALYRYEPGTMVGRNIQSVTVPMMTQAQAAEIMSRLQAGKVWSGEFLVMDSSGRRFPTFVTDTPFHDENGNLVGIVGISRDISAETETRAALQASEQRYRDLVETSVDLIWSIDTAGVITFINGASRRIYGREPAEMIGRPFLDFVPEAQRSTDESAFAQMLTRGGDLQEYIARVYRADGSVVTLDAMARPIRDRQGRIAGVTGIARDMTDRIHAEEMLRASEARFRSLFEQYRLLFEHNPHPMWTYDLETLRFLAVNRAAIDHYGYSEAVFLSMTITDLHPAEDVEWLRKTVLHLAGKRKGFGVWRHRKQDGTLIDVELVSDDVTFNDRPARLVLAKDITESLRVEERLIEQAALLDKANDVITVRDLRHRINYWNASAERVFGWTAAETESQSARELIAQDPIAYDQAAARTLETGEWAGELETRTKDGRPVTMSSRWTLLRNEHGQPKSILTIENDVTERKRVESQALRAQRMESLGTLAGGIAHDLNNVLAPIMMSVELLKEEPLNPEGRALLDTLNASVKRGADLVKQVLSFARGVEGQRVAVDLDAVLRDVIKILQDTFPKPVRIHPVATRGQHRVRGDLTQLHQVILNLCVNARDAMPNGGVLTLRLRQVNLDETYSGLSADARPGDYVVVEVEDTGGGIPPGIRDRIFEPFFTTKELGQGTGLGLSTSLAIVKSHGGFISVYSEVGRGTTFSVHLPVLASEADDLPAADSRSPLPQGNNELILVVDDDENVRDVVTRTLERYGYRAVTAGNGAEAVAIFASRRSEVAAILTDMAMPIMDGPALVLAVRSLDPQVRVIGSSGLASQDGVAQGLHAGLDHFVEKPYTAEALLTTLARVLRG